jgi:hypothetical protein
MAISLRQMIMMVAIALTMLVAATVLPAAAQAKTVSASARGLKATLSYSGGPGITTKDERLTIVQGGKAVYSQPVPSAGCFKVCGPGAKQPVAVASLYGNDGDDVVLTLWNGGADCCTIADVYVPSAAVQSYVLDQHNFGEAGFVLKDIGPKGRPEFVTADRNFYCEFTDCAASGLPLQIFEFSGERFVNITKQYPALISDDAARWSKVFNHDPQQGLGAFVAEIADLENLGEVNGISAAIVDQAPKAHITHAVVARIKRFLAAHHYRTAGL